MKKLLFILCWVLPLLSCGQDSLNIMFYNLYRFPVNSPPNREFLLKHILGYTQPDLLMACEIVTEAGAERVLHTAFQSLPDSFSRAEFVYSTSAADDPLQQTVFYNTRKLILSGQQTLLTPVRDINHFTFRLTAAKPLTDPVFLEVFVGHFKSSEGSGNEALREAMADTFLRALEQIPASHYILFAGDFNFYRSGTEPAYQRILDSNNHILMVDPLHMPGDWHNNPAFQAIHTQSTRSTLDGFGLGGAGGGMDDRFDFIFISKNLESATALRYVSGSYKSLGNNGNCFNRRIDNDSCVGIYPVSLRHILFQMSDHTPVVMQLQTDRSFPTAVTPRKPVRPLVSLAGGNVVRDVLYLRIYQPELLRGRFLYLYDYTGRVLKRISLSEGSPVCAVDVQSFTPGIYFLRLESSVLKFVKR